jgi:hypothetical protein
MIIEYTFTLPTCVAHQGADVSRAGASQPQLSVHKVLLAAPESNKKVTRKVTLVSDNSVSSGF